MYRKSIISWIDHEELNKKMSQPLELDVEKVPWKIPLNLKHSLQGKVSLNMIHVAKSIFTKMLFEDSGKFLNTLQKS